MTTPEKLTLTEYLDDLWTTLTQELHTENVKVTRDEVKLKGFEIAYTVGCKSVDEFKTLVKKAIRDRSTDEPDRMRDL